MKNIYNYKLSTSTETTPYRLTKCDGVDFDCDIKAREAAIKNRKLDTKSFSIYIYVNDRYIRADQYIISKIKNTSDYTTMIEKI